MSESTPETLVCYRHPTTPTSLRCYRCNQPICARCAVRTPVGFSCPDCVRSHQDKFYSGSWLDYLIAIGVALPLSTLTAAIFSLVIAGIPFLSWILAFMIAPAAGGLIAETVRRAVGRRRARYLGLVVVGCLAMATLPFLTLMAVGGNLFGLIVPGRNLLGLVTPALLIFLGGGAILARLR